MVPPPQPCESAARSEKKTEITCHRKRFCFGGEKYLLPQKRFSLTAKQNLLPRKRLSLAAKNICYHETFFLWPRKKLFTAKNILYRREKYCISAISVFRFPFSVSRFPFSILGLPFPPLAGAPPLCSPELFPFHSMVKPKTYLTLNLSNGVMVIAFFILI